MKILHIAIPTPLRKTFDYLPQVDIDLARWQIGQRVKVSFGRRDVVGVITAISDESHYPVHKLKSTLALIDENPLLHEELLTLYHWASDYYQHPIGDVILGSLPKNIRDGSGSGSGSGSGDEIECSMPCFALTPEQQNAIDNISKTAEFKPFLLAGVTGSGKTEVYLRVIAEVLKKNKQALVLVPEISLTPQTVARFEARFSAPVLLLHSGLTDVKRSQAWMKATYDSPCIVIGTRSAVFAPLKHCGVIIVDEEHDISFKQQSGFRYSARDVAIMRAKIARIPVVLGSATPALETIHNVNQKKYDLCVLHERVGRANLPTMTLHNICGEKLQNGLSQKLMDVMRAHLSQGNQILLFLNRRGYAPVLLCHHCGWSAVCPQCDARLTLHDKPNQLLCHHCGFCTTPPRICQSCHQSELMHVGLGTEQLEKTVRDLCPNKTICRVDRDNIKNFKTLEATLTKVHQRDIDILIGTQMLVKGHHFENVTLVAALDVDHALFSSDFRAVERLGQSLIQVAGRAGRAEKAGEVFIQTHYPNHPLLKKLLDHNYHEFTHALLADRSKAQLPPHVYLVLLRAESKNKLRVHDFLLQAKNKMVQEGLNIEIAGPFPSAMEKKAGFYRAQLLIQSVQRSMLKKSLSHFLNHIETQKKVSGLRWVLDVDPVEV